jgi:hypothetical protein
MINEIMLRLGRVHAEGSGVYQDVRKCLLKKFSTRDAAALYLMVQAAVEDGDAV